ncbi:MAG: protein kinase [Polyangiaceae bacterium]
MRESRAHRLGPYELGERLGSGGMAEVYVARRAGPHGFSKRFAIKRILPQLARDPHFVSMFCDEARICAALSHPNIVQVVDFGEHDGELFMAMEYVEGISCARLLRAVAARGERVPLGAALFITHEVLRALSYAHLARDDRGRPLGIVHRDVSPGNVLLGRAGEVKLTDFGIVRSEFIDRRTNPGELKGKIGYMSPEQALGHELDRRSDLFTVAILLAEMLLARPLFPGKNELEILSRIHDADLGVLDRHGGKLPPDLVKMLRRALARQPRRRFESADEFAEALRGVARTARVALNDSELSGWLSTLGIMPMQSGLRPAYSDAAPEAAAATPKLRSVPSDFPTEPAHHADPKATLELELPGGRRERGLDLPAIVERLVTGKLPQRAVMIEPDGNRTPVGRVAALSRFTRQRVYAFGSVPAALPTSAFDYGTLPAFLYSLAEARATGLIVLREGAREKRVYLRLGAPILVASTSANELLGQRLVAEGKLSAEQLSVAMQDALDGAGLVGSALVDRGYLRPAGLLRALHAQLDARVAELGSWSKSEVVFVPGERPRHEVVPPARARAVWVTRMIREGMPPLFIERAVLAAASLPLAASPAPPIDPETLGLEPDELACLRAAPGTRSLGELGQRLAATGLPAETLRRAVFIGLSAGCLVAPGFRRKS